MPAGNETLVTVKDGGGLTVMVKVLLIGVPALSVAWIVKSELPAEVGVPLMITDAVSLFDKLKPVGRLPEISVHVNGPVAPSVVITPL